MATVDTVLLTANDRHRDFTGVTKFHNAGYFGQRVVAASGEDWDINSYNPGGRVRDPNGIGLGGGHAVDTAATFFQVAPKATLYMLHSTNGRYGSTSYESKFFELSVDVIEKAGITSMFVSKNHTGCEPFRRDLSAWMQAHPDFKYFWAAGNDSMNDFNDTMKVPEVTGVAAYTLMADGRAIPAYYSSESEYVDFAAPSMIRVDPKATKPSATGVSKSGTSFSTPWLCGMACLVDDFFIAKTGKPLSREAMIRFFMDHRVDMKDPGFDVKTGYGAVVLPDPSEIDIAKYAGGYDEMIEQFADQHEVSSWAVDSIEFCLEKGIFNGTEKGGVKYIDPKGNVTREQMCCLMERMFKALKNEI